MGLTVFYEIFLTSSLNVKNILYNFMILSLGWNLLIFDVQVRCFVGATSLTLSGSWPPPTFATNLARVQLRGDHFLHLSENNSIGYTYYNNNLSRGFTFMALFKQRQWILLSKWTHDFSFCTRCPFQDIISERWEFWVKFDQCPYFIFITNLSVH